MSETFARLDAKATYTDPTLLFENGADLGTVVRRREDISNRRDASNSCDVFLFPLAYEIMSLTSRRIKDVHQHVRFYILDPCAGNDFCHSHGRK